MIELNKKASSDEQKRRQGCRILLLLIFPTETAGGQELAPDVLRGCKTGCYGVIGPDPSTVLDKSKESLKERLLLLESIYKK